ncbi:hypothetical protein BCR33DRAFT_379272 [Rhizoclosmatium globosum]|uniref:C3H1-type domain-containing protein n=1 Tax=Rhizoclosmatium globosum TaxID=329046 RepID=A0A1Y2BZ50_9FUNG|nr:hypothetical protein BCR33DRAFT_379272 [Rhizoclosmatium globosum]|eukprot:ORY39954.1 hypothetical protein BCR33DRAFT_379272 [Rhizoclosmatium globosum]
MADDFIVAGDPRLTNKKARDCSYAFGKGQKLEFGNDGGSSVGEVKGARSEQSALIQDTKSVKDEKTVTQGQKRENIEMGRVRCHQWEEFGCTRGSKCMYKHIAGFGRHAPLCKFHKSCTLARCQFTHSK